MRRRLARARELVRAREPARGTAAANLPAGAGLLAMAEGTTTLKGPLGAGPAAAPGPGSTGGLLAGASSSGASVGVGVEAAEGFSSGSGGISGIKSGFGPRSGSPRRVVALVDPTGEGVTGCREAEGLTATSAVGDACGRALFGGLLTVAAPVPLVVRPGEAAREAWIGNGAGPVIGDGI